MARFERVVGIDPGTGVKSPLGLASFDPNTREILRTESIWPAGRTIGERTRNAISHFLVETIPSFDHAADLYCLESFVMRGKGGETLQRMIGAILGAIPKEATVIEIQNSTVKNHSAGHGHADKKSVAVGVLDWFKPNKASYEYVQRLILAEAWDELDALAIGVSGYERETKSKTKQKNS